MTCRHGPDAMMQTCILCAAAQLAQEQTRAEQAERDARLATRLAEAAEATLRDLERERDELRERYALVTRIRALQESQIDDLEARVRELEAALREIAAIDSASPEHRIAMRALGDSPAVSTPHLRRGDVVRVKGVDTA